MSAVGVGAAECLKATFDPVREEQIHIGEVLQPFDRSAYLRFTIPNVPAWPAASPAVVLLCDESIAGPIAVHTDLPGSGGFRANELEPGTACRLRRGIGAETTRPYVLSVGTTLELVVERSTLETPLPDTQSGFPAIREGDDAQLRDHAARIVESLVSGNFSDGLGDVESIQLDDRAASLPAELASLTRCWRPVLHDDSELEADDWTRLLGRGPGATPSGDDILAGVTLLLATTATERTHGRIRAAGEHTVALARERTTLVSTTLLGQAVLGRCPPAVADALTTIFTGPPNRSVLVPALDRVADIGHSSGVDMLLGIAIALGWILPEQPLGDISPQ